jgi:hypothetical protein
MRQFRFFQYIPPPAPLSWDIHLKLDNVDHTSKKVRTNWRSHWRIYVDHRLVYIAGPYDIRFRSDYMQWYESAGMQTVFFERHFVTNLDQPQPVPSESVSAVAYVPRGDIPTRQVRKF